MSYIHPFHQKVRYSVIHGPIENFELYFIIDLHPLEIPCLLRAWMQLKELSFCHKLWFYNRHIFSTWWCKPLIFQTIIIWSKMIHSLKYLRSRSDNQMQRYRDKKIRVCDTDAWLLFCNYISNPSFWYIPCIIQ